MLDCTSLSELTPTENGGNLIVELFLLKINSRSFLFCRGISVVLFVTLGISRYHNTLFLSSLYL